MTRRRPQVAARIGLSVVLALGLQAWGIASPVLAHAAAAPFGVASVATMIGGPPDDYLAEAQAIKDAKGSWIRIVVQWHKIEPTRGNFDWSTGDNAISAARAKGLNILVCITGPAPLWAQAPGADPNSIANPPADPAAFGSFTKLVAARYQESVSTWEIWNEPNVPEYFAPLDTRRYAALLQQAHTNIHAVQPQSTVMSGGLSSAPYGIAAVDFVEQLYDHGAGDFSDAVALHPYTYPYPIFEDPESRANAISLVRSVMTSRGQGEKKIWITEYGQATGTSPQAVSPERQSEILIDFLERSSTIPYLGPSFLFTTRDLSSDTSNQHFNYGLYSLEYRPKPVVGALQALYR